jgi:flagellar protein FlbD
VIFITRTNGTRIYLNPELIQTVEATPDTVITLVNNKKMIARDTPQEIAERYIEYRRKVMSPAVSDTAGK